MFDLCSDVLIIRVDITDILATFYSLITKYVDVFVCTRLGIIGTSIILTKSEQQIVQM